jgi:glycosyltransferase involved in cell wall biosynthesis
MDGLSSSPLVTVVTPSYNQGSFIRATIESVLSQDYPNIEYIIMDGGSTDETATVVKDYASRLTFISEKDRGQSHAINKGFRMARGPVLSWLNSDDLFLPGAIRTAVNALEKEPGAGAVYGEGYLIDRAGKITSRFPCTEPLNLWKFVYLSDYILQQTVYFRKEALDRVGYLDEDLHYSMDWDILIRIGMRYPLIYVPEYMGCLREYEEAKTSAGGVRRAREIGRMLRRHTGMRISPGHIVYGLETYQNMWCRRAERLAFGWRPAVRLLQGGIRVAVGTIIGRTIQLSQGLFPQGWAGRVLHYMLPPGGSTVRIEGALPEGLRGQTLRIDAGGLRLAEARIEAGDFRLAVEIPGELRGEALRLTVRASRSCISGRIPPDGVRRQVAYRLKQICWAGPDGAAAIPCSSTVAAHGNG